MTYCDCARKLGDARIQLGLACPRCDESAKVSPGGNRKCSVNDCTEGVAYVAESPCKSLKALAESGRFSPKHKVVVEQDRKAVSKGNYVTRVAEEMRALKGDTVVAVRSYDAPSAISKCTCKFLDNLDHFVRTIHK